MDEDDIKQEGIEEISDDAEASAEELEDTKDAGGDAKGKKPKKKKSMKTFIILGVILVVIIGAGSGVWIWHEQPSFCGAICHTPMDPYLRTFEYEPGMAGFDKWDNAVSNTSGMMAVLHRMEDVSCLDCHVPKLSEQIGEAFSWISGDYDAPLMERLISDLGAARELEGDAFCLNAICHHVSSSGKPIETRADLVAATSNLPRNVHDPEHGALECTVCHKAHRASVVLCSQCHTDVQIPAGWLTWSENLKLNSPLPAVIE